RWLGDARAWLPLAAIGLSPTLLYFNNLATPIATDIEMMPPLVWLLLESKDGKAGPRQGMIPFAIGCLAMAACLTYPAFLLYLPPLLMLYLWSRRASAAARVFAGLAWMAAGFASPLAAALLYLRDVQPFLWDPGANGTGVFRGGGTALTTDASDVWRAIGALGH